MVMRPSIPAALAFSAVLAAIGVVLVFWSFREREAGRLGSADPAMIAAGQAIYREHCASCHGAELQGQPNWQEPMPNGRLPAPPHDASGHTWHHSDEELFRIVKAGMSAVVPDYENDMPGFGDVLSDRDIRAVLAFIKSSWPRRERQYQQERSSADR